MQGSKAAGTCHICMSWGQLTDEHVIPRSSGNRNTVRVHTLTSIANGLKTGERHHKGLVKETLCERCNNDLAGVHFVPGFKRWTNEALTYYPRVREGELIALPFHSGGLSIAKQIGVMTLAMSPLASLKLPHFERLRRFVMSPQRSEFVPSFRFLTYFHHGPPVFEGPFGTIDFFSGKPSPYVYCAIGLEPLGYVITSDGESSLDWIKLNQLCDITHFCRRSYAGARADFLIIPARTGRLPFLPNRMVGTSASA